MTSDSDRPRPALETVRRLWEHLAWADTLLLRALEAGPAPPPGILREYGHLVGVDELWLARLEQRQSRTAIWPDVALADLPAMVRDVHTAWTRYLEELDQAGLSRVASYTNSAGLSFQTPVLDILLHVVLHAQYHRGKVNLLLRQAGLTPVPTDFISFIRGAPAAITEPGGGS